MEDRLDAVIREKAREKGLSLNKTIKLLLKDSLGLNSYGTDNCREEFEDLFGVWSEKDEKDFNKKVKDLNEINPLDWQ